MHVSEWIFSAQDALNFSRGFSGARLSGSDMITTQGTAETILQKKEKSALQKDK